MFKDRRRLAIIVGLGVLFVCIICGGIYVLFPSSDEGEPASPPEMTPTAVQPPVETPLPANTPVPTTVPVVVPTDVPDVDSAQAEYFAEVVPGSLVMTNSMANLSELFLNPQLLDDAWYDNATFELSTLLASAMTMEAVTVPDNCGVCRDVHIELAIILSHSNDMSLDWIDWLGDQSNSAHIDSMAVHIVEIGNAATRATAIMNLYIE